MYYHEGTCEHGVLLDKPCELCEKEDTAMKTHTLKTETEFFDAILTGLKSFEVRKNDRDYQVGDTLILVEVSYGNEPTGLKIARRITYILHGGQYGIDPAYCVLGLDR
jgi:hypothetical protein